MVSQIKIFVFLILASSSVVAEEKLNKKQLVLFIDKTESALGRPVRVELYGISLNTKLSDINLKGLKKNFGVVIDSSVSNTTDERWPNKSIQILQLKLYPRYIGKITIPKLESGKLYSKKKIINVVEGKTSIPELTFSSYAPYEHQQIQLHIKIISSDSTSRLSFKKDAVIKGFEYKPLQFKRTKQGNGRYLLQIGWTLTPLKSGTYKLELPPVEYSVSGVLRKRFFLPFNKVISKKLPQYLPPTIPVGKVSIQSEISPSGLLQKDSISYWKIRLQGQLSNAYKLPPVLRQLKSNDQIQFLPADSERTSHATNELFTSTVIHSIPFKALQNGFLTFPEIRYQYFDPENEKIKTIIYKKESIFVIGAFVRGVVIILFLLLASWTIWLSHKKWKKLKYSKHKREQAIELLNNPSHTLDIREAIHLLSQSEFWPVNLTISQWGEMWESKYQTKSDFKILINDLSSALYSPNSSHNLNEIAENLRALLTLRLQR